MVVTRRGFVGSVIGLVAGLQFKGVEAIVPESMGYQRLYALTRAFGSNIPSLMRYQIAISLDTGEKIWAPGLKSVKVDKEKLIMTFEAQPIEQLTGMISVRSAQVVNDQGIAIFKRLQFPYDIHLTTDDTLHATCTIGVEDLINDEPYRRPIYDQTGS
jgi:hypothetical protein